MIALLSGKLVSKTPTNSIVDCNGVGYEFFHTPFMADQMKEGEKVSVVVV